MKAKLLVECVTAIALTGVITLPKLAQANQYPGYYPAPATQQVVIPQSTAIAAMTTSDIVVELDDAANYPVAMVLAQPLQLPGGGIVAPEGSILNGYLQPSSDGVVIVADLLMAGGQSLSIQANSGFIPSKIQRRSSSTANGVLGSALGNTLGSSIAQAAGANLQEDTRVSGGASAFGFLVGMATGGRKKEVVAIPQGQLQVLTLQAPIVMGGVTPPPAYPPVSHSSSYVPPSNTVAPTNSQVQTEFDFRNNLEYTEGVEKIIAAYRGGQVSVDEARYIIEAADQFATTRLSQRLFPPAGVRRQVLELFNFTYEIDTDNSQNLRF